MPNRILRNWTDSLRFSNVSAEAERMFVRLIMVADDFGRYHADPRLLKAACFPLCDDVTPDNVARWMRDLGNAKLIACYEVKTRPFVAIVNYGQRLKQSRAKFPPPAGKPDNFLPVSDDFPELPGTSRNFPSESETEAESETETNIASLPPSAREIPDWKTVQSFAASIGLAEWRAEDEWNKLEANGWVDAKGHALRKWQPYFTRVKGWWESEGRPMTRPAATSRNGRQTAAQRDVEKTGRTERVKVRQLMPDGSTKWI
jgi:hypothetical protein